jgi:glycerol dehydrogenase-like iron-containing ADH family enzyme
VLTQKCVGTYIASGKGPVLGTICAALDVGVNGANGFVEYSKQMDIAAIHENAIKSMENQMDCNPNLDLTAHIAAENAKKNIALGLATSALANSIGGAAGIGLICGGAIWNSFNLK